MRVDREAAAGLETMIASTQAPTLERVTDL